MTPKMTCIKIVATAMGNTNLQLKDEVHERKLVISYLTNQNQILLKIIKSERASSSKTNKLSFIINIPTPTL